MLHTTLRNYTVYNIKKITLFAFDWFVDQSHFKCEKGLYFHFNEFFFKKKYEWKGRLVELPTLEILYFENFELIV